MGPNSAMWGREAKFECGDEEKGEFCEFFENFVSFLVDRSTIFIEMRSAEVGDMIYPPPRKSNWYTFISLVLRELTKDVCAR